MRKRPDIVSIQGSDSTKPTGPDVSFKAPTGTALEKRAASDFWLALILVLAAAALLDFSVMIF
jgi:hypothetical protein